MNERDTVLRLLRTGVVTPIGKRPPLVLAPMATVTHAGFRTLIHEFGGCDLFFTEMISAEALVGGTQFEQSYRSLNPVPDRTIYQIVGYTAESIARAAERLAAEPCAGIDINMGCSAPHLVRKGGGIAWMYKPDAAARLVQRLRAVVPSGALSAKLRLGRNDDPESLVAFARRLETAGLDFLTLHPKRQREGSARLARWQYVDLLAHELAVPIIGNGGIVDWASYCNRSRTPDGVPRAHAFMIGRGAMRAPWIFAYLRAREAGIPEMEVDLSRVVDRFLHLLEAHQPREFWPSRARRVYPYIFQNVPFGHSLGARLAGTHDYASGKLLLDEFFAAHPDRRTHVERS